MAYQLTKSDIRLIANQWEDKSVRQIAEIIGCTDGTIYRVAKEMRDLGLKLSYKKRYGVLKGLILEVMDEL